MSRVDPTVEILVGDAVRNRLYGTLEFKFEAGKLVLCRKTETIKPSSYEEKEDLSTR